MQIIDGRRVAEEIKKELAEEVIKRLEQGKKIPHLAAILVGSDGASMTYVNAKVKACEEIGFKSTLIHLNAEVSKEELLLKVEQLNCDEEIDGFIVQLPLPAHLDALIITQAISPLKDVDGFHPQNVGNMVVNLPGFLPATPMGILELIKRLKIETAGKHCVVIGRSNIVGMPLSIMLGKNNYPGNCTVTLTHSKTINIEEICRSADILIAAIGQPNFVKATMVKKGAVVIDVGTTRVSDSSRERGWRLVGDVDYENVASICSFITPVPGGVGPMTITSLMLNTLKALELKENQ
jgi:methylenetetrahydrofolate dehydrogenase (NADP+)/methenyltetrahydrofolate cyclohydrolase